MNSDLNSFTIGVRHLFRTDQQHFLDNLLTHFYEVIKNNGFGETLNFPGITGICTCAAPRAIYLFDTISLINHSCAPNSVVLIHDNIAHVVSTRRIEIGEQICHSYGWFDETPDTHTRRIF